MKEKKLSEKMEMKITCGKNVINLKSIKFGKWDIETKASFRNPINSKFDLVSWRILKEVIKNDK